MEAMTGFQLSNHSKNAMGQIKKNLICISSLLNAMYSTEMHCTHRTNYECLLQHYSEVM